MINEKILLAEDEEDLSRAISTILKFNKYDVTQVYNGLDAINDYLTKPFNNKELLARIRASIRNSTERKEKITFGSILFDKEKNEITKDNISLKLNNKESELMEMLIKNKNRKVEEKEITKILDKGKEKEQEKMYINFLQDKLDALNSNAKIIKSFGGYSITTI